MRVRLHAVHLRLSHVDGDLLNVEWAALVRLTVALIFVSSATAKLARPRAFAASVRDYELLPAPIAGPAAGVTVFLEAATAFMLLSGVGVEIGLALAGMLLILFAAVLARALRQDRGVDCGCLGSFVPLRLGWSSMVVNLALAGLALGAIAEPTLGVPFPADPPPAVTVVVLWLAAVLLAATYWLAAYARSVTQLVEDTLARGSEA
jgi:hypothetical protein